MCHTPLQDVAPPRNRTRDRIVGTCDEVQRLMTRTFIGERGKPAAVQQQRAELNANTHSVPFGSTARRSGSQAGGLRFDPRLRQPFKMVRYVGCVPHAAPRCCTSTESNSGSNRWHCDECDEESLQRLMNEDVHRREREACSGAAAKG